ncbi:MAG TPA: bifunctional adenosylcobinamide kinase/adenosylcobinamide-phosphate guanylyltransferase [Bryobacteraceae bacterium]|nr:bifunctional adenosylcobinamide kinase/adenosylcobinamide-phosphate guanylyltransferase [Bryobacteraceae bacterium]
MLTLVIGGARSGKSRFAQSLCAKSAVAYIATARAEDDEMRGRIERHRADRPEHWITIEEPLDLARAARCAPPAAAIVLIDCLTVWLSNLMWERRDRPVEELESCAAAQIDALAGVAAATDVILVSNEVGAGIVPENEVARRFRDLQGLVNQRAAARADRVFLTVAGIALPIKTAQA